MKRLFVQGIVFLSLCVFAIPAWSLVFNDVVQVDDLVSSARLSNSGDPAELQWIRNSLGDQTLGMTTMASNWVELEDRSKVYWLELSDPVSYFFIKIGASPGADDHFLFRNLESLNYLVIDIASTDLTIKNIGKISSTNAIPEPSTLLLLGGGLLGLAVYGRKRMKN